MRVRFLFPLVCLMLCLFSARGENTDVVINEIMPSNKGVLQAEDGYFYDWVELKNISTNDLSMKGYTLTDGEEAWTFPDVTLLAGEYRIVFFSGLETAPEGETHAGFKLPKSGGTITLIDDTGHALASAAWEAVEDNMSVQWINGAYVTGRPATPGYENTDAGVAWADAAAKARNRTGIFINEVCASVSKDMGDADWVELHNASGTSRSLSGYYLTDDPSEPGKYAFPADARVKAGGYYAIELDEDADFGLSREGCETIYLIDPELRIVDMLWLPTQYTDVSYGRQASKDGFYYMETPTKGAENAPSTATSRAEEAVFSARGGIQSKPVTLTLTAPEGARIYYTTDCTEPDESGARYTAPIQINDTLIVRTRVYADGALPSLVSTQSYLFDDETAMRVVSVVAEPDDLFSGKTGIYDKGYGAQSEFPYKGANFWKDWTRDANVEIYEANGDKLISQGAQIEIHGNYSRGNAKKSLKLTAKSVYGLDSFAAALFPNRDYAEYHSFVLRAGGTDFAKTFMADEVITSMAEGMDIFYQDASAAIVYINGAYYGIYHIRETTGATSIAQWADCDADDLDIVQENIKIIQGSDDSYQAVIDYISGVKDSLSNGNIAWIERSVDLENYYTFVAFQMYTANTDLYQNIKRYRNAVSGDGKWRWVLFDFDGGMVASNTNSVKEWFYEKRVNGVRNDLFRALMTNKAQKARFLTVLGEMMETVFAPENAEARFRAKYAEYEPELKKNLTRWGVSLYYYNLQFDKRVNFLNKRPDIMLTSLKSSLRLTAAEIKTYFGGIMDLLE